MSARDDAALDESRPAPERTPSLRHRIEYAALRAFAGLVSVLGLSAGYVLAKLAGSAIHAMDRRHREIARANLREHLRDAAGNPLPERDVRRIARDSFRHLVMCAVEVVHLPRQRKRHGLTKLVNLTGIDTVREALASGRGAILATAHVGNWEVVGASCNEIGVPYTTVYRQLDNPLLDRWVRSTRAAAGQTMVEKHGAMRPLLKTLRSGGLIVLLVDQDARSHGVFAPFFGTPASTIPTPAELALRTGAVLMTAASLRTGPGFRFDTWIDAPLEVTATDDHAADLVRITTEINRSLESVIRRAPEQWLWSHRRWKTKAPG